MESYSIFTVAFMTQTRDLCSPGIHSPRVMHEVGGHLKGKADRIERSNRIYHSFLIIL